MSFYLVTPVRLPPLDPQTDYLAQCLCCTVFMLHSVYLAHFLSCTVIILYSHYLAQSLTCTVSRGFVPHVGRLKFKWPSFLLFAGARCEHSIVSPLLQTNLHSYYLAPPLWIPTMIILNSVYLAQCLSCAVFIMHSH
jgi:hypothetical protein